MKTRCAPCVARLSLLALAFVGTAASSFSYAQQPEAAPAKQPERSRGEGRGPGGPGGQGGGEIRSLESAMKILNGSLKRLSKQIDQADKKDDNLLLIASAQRGALAAKGMKPENIPAGSGPDALKGYHAAQITLSRMLLDLEEQVLNDKAEDAKKTIVKLNEFKDESHKKFAPDEDEQKLEAKPEGGPEKHEGAPGKK